MNTHDELERRLRGWMVDTAPAHEPAGLVVRAMAGTERVRQRPGFVVDSGLGRRWPAVPRWSPAARFALVALLALAALVAAVLAGALPVPREPLLARNGLIAYELDDNGDLAYYTIRLVSPDGTGDRAFARGGSPVFSRDGRYLAYATALRFRDDLDLLVVAMDGSSRRSVPGFMLMGFALSPDGSMMAMRRVDDAGNVLREVSLVSVVDASRRTLVHFPADPQLSYTELAWSPDGRSIACVVRRRDETGAEYAVGIDVVDVATGQVRRVSSRLGDGVWGVSWSPDGGALAFTAWPDGTPTPQGDQFGGYAAPAGDVFVVGIDGTDERNLSSSTAFDERPAWSPDGSSIAWLTTGDEGRRLAVVAVRDLESAGAPAFGPPAERFVWAPDGGSLLSTRHRPVKPGSQFHVGTIQRVDVALSPRVELRPPVTLLERSDAIGSLSWQPLFP